MSGWIGETFTSDVGWSHLETLVDIGNRMAGSEGERRAAAATRDTLAEHARDAHLEEFPVQGWTRGTSAIRAGGTEQDCIALPRSPSGSATGTFVDLGYGLPSDFEGDEYDGDRSADPDGGSHPDAGSHPDTGSGPDSSPSAELEGAIVMARSDVPDWFDPYIHRREKYLRAVEAGASAFVYRNHVEGCLPPTGSVSGADAAIGDVPAVGVSAEVGARLARRFEGESVTVEVEADIHDATSRNVHADLGPATDSAVYVTSHVDAHDIAEGAMDNGAGTAMVVELARALASREADLDTRVHFVCFGAEEVGLVGSEYLADRVDLDAIDAVLNNDGVARDRTLSFDTNGFAALADAVSRVAGRFDHPMETSPKPGPHSDHWPFVSRGVPGCHAHSKTTGQGRGWGHTFADTIDKLEPRNFRESAVLLTDLAVELAREDVDIPHKDPQEIAELLRAEDLAEGMKLTGDWPFD